MDFNVLHAGDLRSGVLDAFLFARRRTFQANVNDAPIGADLDPGMVFDEARSDAGAKQQVVDGLLRFGRGLEVAQPRGR
jgi:hypothetical protein